MVEGFLVREDFCLGRRASVEEVVKQELNVCCCPEGRDVFSSLEEEEEECVLPGEELDKLPDEKESEETFTEEEELEEL